MTTSGSTLEFYMLELINAERAAFGLSALQLEQNLNQSAEDHSLWMLQTDTFSHTGSGGSSAGDRMAAADFTFSGSWSWGENIGFQSERGAAGLFDDVADIHERLMNSPGHRANILSSNFDYVGIGIEFGDYRGYDGVMITQNFARTSANVTVDTGEVAQDPAPPPPPAAVVVPPPPEPEPVVEVIRGDGGHNLLTGGSDGEEMRGGGGRDTVRGNDGEDTLYGGSESDLLEGGAGDDTLHGGNGQDWLRGGAGADELRGGRGVDIADYIDVRTGGAIADLANQSANAGAAAGDTYYSVAWLRGTNFNDQLRGNDGANQLHGWGGNDILNGRDGNDTLDGGVADDVLRGGQDDDVLYGRSGADRFVFEINMGRDTVMDFEDDIDMLDFRAMGYSSRDALMARADQVGADVIFDLAGTDALVIRNATLAEIQDDLLF